MHPFFRRIALALGLAALLGLPGVARALDPVSTGTFSNVAVDGYDPVAYFTEGKPVKGADAFEAEYKGATVRFASAANRDLFVKSPDKYMPQYGGHCAWAIAEGKDAPGDGRYWKIVDGRLFLNYDASVQSVWEKDIAGFIARADGNWPKLLNR